MGGDTSFLIRVRALGPMNEGSKARIAAKMNRTLEFHTFLLYDPKFER
jgi:hypothetical protein